MRVNTTTAHRAAMLALSTALVLTLRAPLAEAAPDPAAWAETSGYNALEANRAAAAARFLAPDPGFALDAIRVQRARAALASGELGGMQEEALSRLVAAAPESMAASWAETSGYNTLERNRAVHAGLIGAPESAEADVLYAIDADRAMAAEAALASGDLGSMQEEALTQVVEAADAANTIDSTGERITQFGRIR